MSPLISAAELHSQIAPDWIILDCRFNLGDPDSGQHAFIEGHVPGAQYAHLDRDLSSPITESSGRHPLPDPETFARSLASWGIGPASTVVVYDDASGMFAARAWWLLRWMGHARVCLLDGGLAAWLEAGGTMTSEITSQATTPTYPLPDQYAPTAAADGLLEQLAQEKAMLVDARAANRFAGKEEPIDPIAGHVPGALNRPVTDNLDDTGRFKNSATLKAEWLALLGTNKTSDRPIITMCGSGVTACHHLLALEIAGFSGGVLYPGSWSEWIRDPARPVATNLD